MSNTFFYVRPSDCPAEKDVPRNGSDISFYQFGHFRVVMTDMIRRMALKPGKKNYEGEVTYTIDASCIPFLDLLLQQPGYTDDQKRYFSDAIAKIRDRGYIKMNINPSIDWYYAPLEAIP